MLKIYNLVSGNIILLQVLSGEKKIIFLCFNFFTITKGKEFNKFSLVRYSLGEFFSIPYL